MKSTMNIHTSIVLLAFMLVQPLLAQDRDRASRFDTDILKDTFGYDFSTPSDVPYDDIMQGCQRRDCIPAIDDPVFVAAADADFVRGKDLVLGVVVNGDARAYPELIMNYHEIVNDTIGGEPVAVTFCPLCGSGVAFERVLQGEEVEFGVSGLLHGNDLIMYDRTSDSLWQQITGKAIMGPMRGRELTTVPLAMVEWKTWRQAHPDSKVLSTATGHSRDYSRGPYGDYTGSDSIMFPLTNRDLRMHPKTVVHGFEIDGRSLAVKDKSLGADALETSFAGRELSIQKTGNGLVTATDSSTGKTWEGMRLFWFAWYNFHPDTVLTPDYS